MRRHKLQNLIITGKNPRGKKEANRLREKIHQQTDQMAEE